MSNFEDYFRQNANDQYNKLKSDFEMNNSKSARMLLSYYDTDRLSIIFNKIERKFDAIYFENVIRLINILSPDTISEFDRGRHHGISVLFAWLISPKVPPHYVNEIFDLIKLVSEQNKTIPIINNRIIDCVNEFLAESVGFMLLIELDAGHIETDEVTARVLLELMNFENERVPLRSRDVLLGDDNLHAALQLLRSLMFPADIGSPRQAHIKQLAINVINEFSSDPNVTNEVCLSLL